MKLPHPPPDPTTLLATLGSDALLRAFQSHTGPMVKNAYLHWDELRHREPPQGLSHEHWWLAIKFARLGLFQPLPLLDKHGQPFLFGAPEPVQIDLHHIDQDAAGETRSPGVGTTTARRDDYLLRSLIEESITSSQLEGASTTRRVAAAMLREGRRPRDRDERMIFNNFRTMRAIQGFKDEPIPLDRILEL